MQALIFAAGLGTRLRPHTLDRPKAMVAVDGMPLLEIVIRRLRFYGFRRIVVNVHHYAPMIVQFLEEKRHFGVDIRISDETAAVLETGGGLRKAAPLLVPDAPTLLHNVDILTDLNYVDLLQARADADALATLATRDRATSRYLLFSPEGQQLVGWRNARTEEERWSRPQSADTAQQRAFSGVHVVAPELPSKMQREGKFSIIDTYLDLACTHTLTGYDHTADAWLDVGKPETLAIAGDYLQSIRGELN